MIDYCLIQLVLGQLHETEFRPWFRVGSRHAHRAQRFRLDNLPSGQHRWADEKCLALHRNGDKDHLSPWIYDELTVIEVTFAKGPHAITRGRNGPPCD